MTDNTPHPNKISDDMIARAVECLADNHMHGLAAEVLRMQEQRSTALSEGAVKEREAFLAGYEAGLSDARTDDEDNEQAWQQYRCQDDTDWKPTSGGPIQMRQDCEHDPLTYAKHPSGDVVTKCRKCGEVIAHLVQTQRSTPNDAKFTENVKKCIGNDPLCPCQDGDMCHYEGPDAWTVPAQTRRGHAAHKHVKVPVFAEDGNTVLRWECDCGDTWNDNDPVHAGREPREWDVLLDEHEWTMCVRQDGEGERDWIRVREVLHPADSEQN